MAKFCGGIRIGETLGIEDGVITIEQNLDPIDTVTTPCGQKFDGAYFEVVRHNGSYLLTAAGVDENIPLLSIIKSNCGLNLDGRFFLIREGKVEFLKQYLLEVLVNPADVDYVIEVTQNGLPIDPLEGSNIYPMDNIGAEYVVTVNADGYDEFTQNVTAEQDHIVQATLTPTGP